MAEKKGEILPLTTENSPNFSVIHADGVFGGISIDQGTAWIQFFQDIPCPEVVSPNGKMVVTKVRRELLIDIRMSTHTFKEVAKWMNDTISKVESIKK